MGNDESDRSDYLGAMLDERRLVLVPLDPDRPWAAFRRMRAWMKRARPKSAQAAVGIFETPATIAHADVIPLRPKDAER